MSSKPNLEKTKASILKHSCCTSRVKRIDKLWQVKSLIEKEQDKNHKLKKEFVEMNGKMMDLSRRLQDTTRAYEQKKRENDLKDARIRELLSNSQKSQVRQELKYENQRMMDEHNALMKVIERLS